MGGFKHWNWNLDEMYVKIGGEMRCFWRAVDGESEILESYVSTTRDKKAALAEWQSLFALSSHPPALILPYGDELRPA